MNDLKFALRQLLKNPGFTTVAVLTLALGIGANTAIFSVVNAVLLRPLTYPESDRLVWLAERGPDWDGGSIAYPNYVDWRAQQTVFEQIGVYNWNSFTLTGQGEPVQLQGAQISASAFQALRVQPAVGRLFAEEEDKPGAARTVLLSHALWQSRFGGDVAIISQAIQLDGNPYTVVGIMPAGFNFPNDSDALSLWVPAGPLSADPEWQNRGNHPGLYGVARLKPGITLAQARVEMDAISLRLEQQYPETNKTRRAELAPWIDNVVGWARRGLWILLGAVALVLLIACANVANLQLARAAGRQKELAVRSALGAGRWRIGRQLLVESVLLSAIGGLAGILVAQGALTLITTMALTSLPRAAGIDLDARVLWFSGAVALLTGVIFGLAPAWQASRADVQETLKANARGVAASRGGLRQALVVAEVALTLVLLIGAGLLLRSFQHLQQTTAGFNSDKVLAFRVGLPTRKYQDHESRIRFYQQLLENLRRVPGVTAASVTSRLPLEGGAWDTTYSIDGEPEPEPHQRPSMNVQLAGPDYFRVMGIPILRGRAFTETDHREHLRGTGQEQEWGPGLNAIIVDEEFARRHWPKSDPVGKRVRWGGGDPLMTVVGVASRVKWRHISETQGYVQAYVPFLQAPSPGMTVVVKTTQEPESLTAAARQQVLALDPEQPIYRVETLAARRERNVSGHRMNLRLLAIFAGVAVTLAVVGLYGVLAYAVTQRERELGIRMALGAQRGQVLGLVLGEGMKLSALGIIIGLAGALALTRVMTGLLFEVQPHDPLTFMVITALLASVTLIACWLPARKATQVDPMVALRAE